MAKMIMTAGSPGAGKGYIIKKHYSDWNVIDCDKFKEQHPDYDPKNPGALHAWSSKECTKAIFAAIAADEDFIYDGTGTNIEKAVNFINQARLAGYEVEVVYVKVSLNTALKRNEMRERTVPADLLREKFATVSTAVDILSSYVDRVVTYNND